jgi:uncharacterized protein YprB with RNaseH-like and TPR domain
LKISTWDIETTDLKGAFGRLIAASVYDEPEGTMTTYRIDDYMKRKLAKNAADDKQLCIDLRDHLERRHVHVGWYSKGFDIMFLRSRLAKHGERPLREMLHVDGIWYCKGWRGIKAKGGKLAHLAEFFDLDDRKMAVEADTWVAAWGGDSDALDIICDRCESDVKLTAEVTERLFSRRG